jgi:sulfite exporter TauE/SafE
MHFPEGFILGLSTGAVCMAYCGPVLLPYLMGEAATISRNTISVGLFLGGRLAAYMLVGLLAGLLGYLFLQQSGQTRIFFGVVYIFLALFLIAYGFHRFKEICLGHGQKNLQPGQGNRWPFLVPLTGGFATGLNVCPPFMLAITGAIETKNISGSLLFFILFFLGTSVYFIPLPFLGFFKRKLVLQVIGKFAAILAGLFYLYKGFILLL